MSIPAAITMMSSDTARLFGYVIHAEYVSLAGRRACLDCLRESPHHRSIWDFSLLIVCPEHGLPLVDRWSIAALRAAKP